MSYDVSIGDDSFNYTYNVGRLFHDHIPDMGLGGGLHEINGASGRKAVRILSQAFERINRTQRELWVEGAKGEPEFCARYDAKNGWGSTVGALIFLAQILAASAENPRKKVRVS